MKKKSYLIIALAAVLILSATYAYTYPWAGVAGEVGAARDIATVNASATQPDWEDILTPVWDIEILRPHAAGDEANIPDQYPAVGEHWDKVDEATPDGDSSYVYTDLAPWREDLYHIADHSLGVGTIDYVKVYMVCRATKSPTQTNAYVHIKTNGVEYNGSEVTTTTSYADYLEEWTTNPNTNEAWTWGEIDGLQIGVRLRRPRPGEETRCTQVYAEVGYKYIPLQGEVPTGDLFVITVGEYYTGDLQVVVYLTNTGALIKAYRYLNMKLELRDKDGNNLYEGETPDHRLLTLENGVTTFDLECGAGAGSPYHIYVAGGSYCLVSRDSSEWSPGWSVTPQLYCEVKQK